MIFATAVQVDSYVNNTIECKEISGDRKTYKIEYTGGVELNPGDQIILTGDITEHGYIAHNTVSVRRFLEPLNEEDLLEQSARFKMVQPINDPFFKFYQELLPKSLEIMKLDNVNIEDA